MPQTAHATALVCGAAGRAGEWWPRVHAQWWQGCQPARHVAGARRPQRASADRPCRPRWRQPAAPRSGQNIESNAGRRHTRSLSRRHHGRTRRFQVGAPLHRRSRPLSRGCPKQRPSAGRVQPLSWPGHRPSHRPGRGWVAVRSWQARAQQAVNALAAACSTQSFAHPQVAQSIGRGGQTPEHQGATEPSPHPCTHRVEKCRGIGGEDTDCRHAVPKKTRDGPQCAAPSRVPRAVRSYALLSPAKMSFLWFSGTKAKPITTVISAITIGYQRP